MKRCLSLIQQINLNKVQIERVAQKLKRFLERLERAEGEIIHCTKSTGMPLEELKKVFAHAKKNRQGAKKIAKKTGIAQEALLDYERTIRNARKNIKIIETESTFNMHRI